MTYTIEAFNLGTNCNVVIELYNTDGTNLLAIQNNDIEPGAAERVIWRCPLNGTYYVKFRQYQSDIFGVDTEYDIKIGVSQSTCQGDFDGDNDVDGGDLVEYALEIESIALEEFAAGFGKLDCRK